MKITPNSGVIFMKMLETSANFLVSLPNPSTGGRIQYYSSFHVFEPHLS
ncbi:hypothetical protein [Nostoc sp.]